MAIIKFFLVSFLILTFSGCITVDSPYAPGSIPAPQPNLQQRVNVPGIFHRVEKGQTLWRISKIYGIDLDELVSINNIPDATSIEVGQQIFIPNRLKQQTVSASGFSSDDFIWPMKGRVIATFGSSYNNMIVKGINIQPYGNLNVLASSGGKVVFCDEDFPGYGKTVIIQHANGLSTVYSRNAEILVKPGDTVTRGTIIAKAGAAARDSGVYLHFQVRKGHIPKNPLYYLP